MRTLVLKKETLSELAVDDLRRVVGGDSVPTTVATRIATICADPLSLHCFSWHTEEC
jgi:hypothetical protein